MVDAIVGFLRRCHWSLNEQLAKPDPDRSVVAALWSAIEKVAAIATLAPLVAAIAPQVQHLLH
jgi:hypothetical protein